MVSVEALRASIETSRLSAAAADRVAASFEEQELALRPSCRALPSLSAECRFLAERRLACSEELAKLTPAVECAMRGLAESKVRLREEIAILERQACDGQEPRERLRGQKELLARQVASSKPHVNDLHFDMADVVLSDSVVACKSTRFESANLDELAARAEVMEAKAALDSEVRCLCLERIAADAQLSQQQAHTFEVSRRACGNFGKHALCIVKETRRTTQHRVELWARLCELRVTRAAEAERCEVVCKDRYSVARVQELQLCGRVHAAQTHSEILQTKGLKAESDVAASFRFVAFARVSPVLASLLAVVWRLAISIA